MSTKRAGAGDGKVFRGNDGRWYAFIELEPSADGKRRRKKLSGTSRDQVILKRNTIRADLAKGITPTNGSLTVAQLVELWLEHREGRVSASTLSNYKTVAKCHITNTAVGLHQLSKLTALDVSKHLLEREKTHSPRMVKLIRTVLGATIGWAEQQGLVQRNVVKWTEGPRLGQSTHRAMTEDQARAVLAAAKGTRYEGAFPLMLTLGLRPGECLGLRWTDVDFKNQTLTVRHGLKRDGTVGEVKNDGSRRMLSLPEPLVGVLRSRQVVQKADRLKAGEYWQAGPDPLVFTTGVGLPVSDRNLAQRDFAGICEKAKVGTWHLHECRHTAATIMLTNRVPIVVCKAEISRPQDWVDINAMYHAGTNPDKTCCLAWLDLIVGEKDPRRLRLASVLS